MKGSIKLLNLREKDPYLEREGQRYDYPLPSREWVTKLLGQKDMPAKMEALMRELSITDAEYKSSERRLKAMVRDGQVLANCHGAVRVANKIDLIRCRVEAHKDGSRFTAPLQPTGDDDFILYERQMHGMVHGGIITVRPVGIGRRGRHEGTALDIAECVQKQVVGRFYVECGIAILEAEDERPAQSIVLEPDSVADFKPGSGQVIVAEIGTYPGLDCPAVVRIIEILGDYADSGMEIGVTVHKHHLPHRLSRICRKAAEGAPNHMRKSDLGGRVDLHNLLLVTVNGETAHDLDGTVFAERIDRNYRPMVAIANVDHYVRPSDAINNDALKRTTSMHLPYHVIPTLSENLSDDVCSLDPDVGRLCMTCDMMVTYAGSTEEYKFYPAVTRSHTWLAHNQIWSQLSDDLEYPYKEQTDTLYRLFKILQEKHSSRGAAEFENVGTQMVFDGNGKIEKIVPVAYDDVHKLIEGCMLTASVCATEFLLKNEYTALLRNHLGSTPEKLATLHEQFALTGLSLGGRDNPTPKDYAVLAEQFGGRSDAELLQVMVLHSMQQAVHESNCGGHFGLVYGAYARFTSSIRHYLDLAVYRTTKAVLTGEKYSPGKSWRELGVHTSFYERRTGDASHDVEDWLKTYYMWDKVSEVLGGRISGMISLDIFITLDDVYIDGLVYINGSGEGYFNYCPETMTIKSERSGMRLSVSNRVNVRVAYANLDTSKVDLLLVSDGTTDKKCGRKAVSASKSPSELTARKSAVKAARGRKSRVGIKEANTLTKETGKSNLCKGSVSGRVKAGKRRESVKVVMGSRSKTKGKPKAGGESQQSLTVEQVIWDGMMKNVSGGPYISIDYTGEETAGLDVSCSHGL